MIYDMSIWSLYTKDSFAALLSHFEQSIASFLLFFYICIIWRLNILGKRGCYEQMVAQSGTNEQQMNP